MLYFQSHPLWVTLYLLLVQIVLASVNIKCYASIDWVNRHLYLTWLGMRHESGIGMMEAVLTKLRPDIDLISIWDLTSTSESIQPHHY